MLKGRVPKGYVWKAQWTVRKERRGRTNGEMLMDCRKEIQRKMEQGGEMKRKG